jgi:hypothetical protein
MHDGFAKGKILLLRRRFKSRELGQKFNLRNASQIELQTNVFFASETMY